MVVLMDVLYWGGGQSAVIPGKAENLKNVSCSCCGSVILGGGVNLKFTAHLPFHALLHCRSVHITYKRLIELISFQVLLLLHRALLFLFIETKDQKMLFSFQVLLLLHRALLFLFIETKDQ